MVYQAQSGLSQFLIFPITDLCYKQGIDQFVLLADANKDLPNLSRPRVYADFQLTQQDWEHLAHIKDAIRVCLSPIIVGFFVLMPLQELSDTQQTFSKESAPTIWHIIPTFEFLLQCWETMAAHFQHHELKSALNEGVKSLHKWHARVEGACGTYFICLGMFLFSIISQFLLVANYCALVLDPNVKDLYFRAQWDSA
jgi:hypothetical protein